METLKVYFEETDDFNQLIFTDGETAKILGGGSDGTFEGMDLYGEDVVNQLKQYFEESYFDLTDFYNLWGDEMDFEGIEPELENAELIYEN